MGCQFIPRLPSGTSSGFLDNFPVLLDGEIHCEYTAQWPGQATNPDFSTWSLAHLPWDRPPQLLSRGGSNIPNRVFLRFPEEGSWGISSGQRCFLPRLLSYPLFKQFTYRLESRFAPLFESSDDGLSVLAEIRYDGQIKIAVPTILSISCLMDMTMYPFDIQRCNPKFGESTFSWTLSFSCFSLKWF